MLRAPSSPQLAYSDHGISLPRRSRLGLQSLCTMWWKISWIIFKMRSRTKRWRYIQPSAATRLGLEESKSWWGDTSFGVIRIFYGLPVHSSKDFSRAGELVFYSSPRTLPQVLQLIGTLHSWAETAQITPSSCLSSPTDTDPVIPSLSLVPETVSLACSDENENGNETDDSKRASIYLEANEDEPNVADILRELREIPNVGVPSRPLNTPSDEALGEIQSPRSPLPILLQLQTCQPLPPTITTTVPSQRRSGIRHSFSSMTGPNRRDGLAEAVVELHEESASAFQDFLFWAYPQSVLMSHPKWRYHSRAYHQSRVQSLLDQRRKRMSSLDSSYSPLLIPLSS